VTRAMLTPDGARTFMSGASGADVSQRRRR
jgi:hypothetical protein